MTTSPESSCLRGLILKYSRRPKTPPGIQNLVMEILMPAYYGDRPCRLPLAIGKLDLTLYISDIVVSLRCTSYASHDLRKSKALSQDTSDLAFSCYNCRGLQVKHPVLVRSVALDVRVVMLETAAQLV